MTKNARSYKVPWTKYRNDEVLKLGKPELLLFLLYFNEHAPCKLASLYEQNFTKITVLLFLNRVSIFKTLSCWSTKISLEYNLVKTTTKKSLKSMILLYHKMVFVCGVHPDRSFVATDSKT